jgi:uncharacterized protein with PIN domain
MPDRLLLDAMLGTLSTYLRMCGYDAAYVLDGVAPEDEPGDDAIAERARSSGRTVLTRDRDLAARVDGAVLLRSRDVTDQLSELRAAGYDLSLDDEPARCGGCNGEVRQVGADESLPAYAPDPEGTDCWRCRACGQVFWKGGHWDDVRSTLDSV